MVKVSDWNALRSVRQVMAQAPSAEFLVHSTLVPCSGTPVHQSGPIWNELERLIPLTRPPFLSVHIGYNCQVDYDAQGRYVFGPRLAEEALLANLRANVDRLRQAFALDVILENQTLVYGGSFRPPYMEGCADPAFINGAIGATGCDLLLDLAHGRVNAEHLGMAVEDYLQALPLEKTREIHLSGCRAGTDGALADAHEELAEEDYALLEWLLARVRPQVLTLEYDGDGEALVRQLNRLKSLANSPPVPIS